MQVFSSLSYGTYNHEHSADHPLKHSTVSWGRKLTARAGKVRMNVQSMACTLLWKPVLFNIVDFLPSKCAWAFMDTLHGGEFYFYYFPSPTELWPLAPWTVVYLCLCFCFPCASLLLEEEWSLLCNPTGKEGEGKSPQGGKKKSHPHKTMGQSLWSKLQPVYSDVGFMK